MNDTVSTSERIYAVSRHPHAHTYLIRDLFTTMLVVDQYYGYHLFPFYLTPQDNPAYRNLDYFSFLSPLTLLLLLK